MKLPYIQISSLPGGPESFVLRHSNIASCRTNTLQLTSCKLRNGRSRCPRCNEAADESACIRTSWPYAPASNHPGPLAGAWFDQAAEYLWMALPCLHPDCPRGSPFPRPRYSVGCLRPRG